jgi:hypothetical protein
VGVLQQIRHHDRREAVFWAVRLGAEQDNLLATWSWAIDTGNVDTAFSILAGFAPSEVSYRYPLPLDGEPALELPGAAAHPGYPLALAVSARFASRRGDVTLTEELCRGAAEGRDWARRARSDAVRVFGINPPDPRPIGGDQLETLPTFWKQRLDRDITRATDQPADAKVDERQTRHTALSRSDDQCGLPSIECAAVRR